MIIDIPVYPHVRKMLLYKQSSEPIKADFTTRLGLTIRAILHSHAEKSSPNERMTATISVELNQDLDNLNHRLKRLIKINDYFDKDFKTIMVHSVEDQMMAGVPALTAVKNFLNRLDISDKEYSHETAYRYWLREKNSEYDKAKAKKKSQLCHKITSVMS